MILLSFFVFKTPLRSVVLASHRQFRIVYQSLQTYVCRGCIPRTPQHSFSNAFFVKIQNPILPSQAQQVSRPPYPIVAQLCGAEKAPHNCTTRGRSSFMFRHRHFCNNMAGAEKAPAILSQKKVSDAPVADKKRGYLLCGHCPFFIRPRQCLPLRKTLCK